MPKKMPTLGTPGVASGGRSYAPPTWKLLDVAVVKQSMHNPKRRVGPSRLKELVRSMAEDGLFYPVLVDTHNVLIDGHRRLAAAKLLGWETIPALVHGADPNRIYAAVNSTVVKMGGTDTLTVWLRNRNAVPARIAKVLASMEQVIGKKETLKLAERGLSARTYQTACRIGRYCGRDSPEDVRNILRWLTEVAIIGQVMKALEAGRPRQDVWIAVEKNQQL
jgi:hypothetical protein